MVVVRALEKHEIVLKKKNVQIFCLIFFGPVFKGRLDSWHGWWDICAFHSTLKLLCFTSVVQFFEIWYSIFNLRFGLMNVDAVGCWSGQSSMTGSFSAMSSGGPSSPENSISRSELSASIASER